MKRLLLDENVPRAIGEQLQADGHDAVSMATISPGLSDAEVLALACSQQRCLVTFDSDFGELVFARRHAPPPAIYYLRMHPIVLSEVGRALTDALQTDDSHALVVIGRDGLRKRPFPV